MSWNLELDAVESYCGTWSSYLRLIWEDIALDLDVFEIGGRREGHLRPNLEVPRFARVAELVTTDLVTSGSQN